MIHELEYRMCLMNVDVVNTVLDDEVETWAVNVTVGVCYSHEEGAS
jgi:hypothetical protein